MKNSDAPAVKREAEEEAELSGGFDAALFPTLKTLPGTATTKDGQPMVSGEWVVVIVLPRKDGIAVCRTLRQHQITTPIVMLTARDAVEDRVLGLDSGADDYLVKPFALHELLARLRALFRRAALQKSGVLVMGVGLVARPSVQEDQPKQESKVAGPVTPAERSKAGLDRHGDALPPGALARMGTVRFRPGARVDRVLFSPDGKLLVSESWDHIIRVWETSSGRELRRFGGPGSKAEALGFCEGGKAIAARGAGTAPASRTRAFAGELVAPIRPDAVEIGLQKPRSLFILGAALAQ